jgi:acetyl esterase/lipase
LTLKLAAIKFFSGSFNIQDVITKGCQMLIFKICIRHRFFFLAILAMYLVSIYSLSALAVPGGIIDVRFDRKYSPQEIDKLDLQLFKPERGEYAPRAKFTVDAYWLIYESTALNGSSTEVTAQMFIPRYSTNLERPIYLFAPGSTGITSACRPSREHTTGIRWGQYRTHVLTHAGQGVIGLLPDYMHFNEPDKVQPYLIAEAEGRIVLDALRAIRHYFVKADYAVRPAKAAFVAGYSQGGHAAFAAADLQASYAPDVHLSGVIGYGPSTDLQNLFKEFTVIAPLVAYVYSRIYGFEAFNPAEVLADKWFKTLDYDVTRQCIGSIQTYYPWNPREMFRAEFADALLKGQLEAKYPSVYRLLTKNSSGLAGHKIPALILQGTDDVVVWEKSQLQFVRRLCEAGSAVHYVLYKGAKHDTRQIGFGVAQRWMEALTSGIKPVSSCVELETRK